MKPGPKTKNPPREGRVGGFGSDQVVRARSDHCYRHTVPPSRLTRFRPMVLCVANILLSVDASIAQRQGVSPADYQHELESAHSRNNGCRGLKVLLAAVSLTSYKVTCV